MQVLELNKEILMEKEQVILGLNARETVCSLLGVTITAGGYLFLQNAGLGLQGGSWLAIVIGVPFFAIGFYKKNGLPLEKYIGKIIESKYTVPQKRPMDFPNFNYEVLVNERNREEIINAEKDKVSEKKRVLHGQKNNHKKSAVH